MNQSTLVCFSCTVLLSNLKSLCCKLSHLKQIAFWCMGCMKHGEFSNTKLWQTKNPKPHSNQMLTTMVQTLHCRQSTIALGILFRSKYASDYVTEGPSLISHLVLSCFSALRSISCNHPLYCKVFLHNSKAELDSLKTSLYTTWSKFTCLKATKFTQQLKNREVLETKLLHRNRYLNSDLIIWSKQYIRNAT